MHFDQREQQALREAGLSTGELEAASDRVADLVDEAAADLEAFFEAHDTLHSDLSMAHSSSEFSTHEGATLDPYTHAADLRGWLRFETWGAFVEDGRVLDEDLVELKLGPTVHERVRFATTPDAL
ncbi:hypothetical protein BRC93_10465 [Halobacteriales archaeon QS_5_70_15]|jgi:hypothetical protein|nr:MAG: hypothetical protein BRC93_10465 [Halobacteriales archaeon QS_5_70_15]